MKQKKKFEIIFSFCLKDCLFQQFFLKLVIFAREIGRKLCFAMVIAKGAFGEGQYRRCLNAFGNGKAGEQLPPALQIGNQCNSIGTGFVNRFLRTAELCSQRACLVPAQDICRRCFVPIFDKGTQQVIMIAVNQRVTAVAYCLCVRKLGAGTDGEDGFGDYFAFRLLRSGNGREHIPDASTGPQSWP